ncbi:MAG: hypothetical protein WC227_00920 [Patescibacteria group bacterium]|jgi:hypothetical protein
MADQDVKKSLDDIKDDLFSALNIAGVSDSDKKVLAAKMYRAVEDRAIARFMTEATEEQKAKIDEIAKQNDPKLFDQYIEDNYASIEQIFQEEALKLRSDLIAKFGK